MKTHLKIIKETNPQIIELFNGILEVLWGLWLINPYWNTFAQSHSWSTLKNIANEYTWGCIILIIGLSHILALFGDKYYIIRRVALLSSIVFWTNILMMFSLSNVATTAIPAYFMLLMSYIWAYYKIERHHL